MCFIKWEVGSGEGEGWKSEVGSWKLGGGSWVNLPEWSPDLPYTIDIFLLRIR